MIHHWAPLPSYFIRYEGLKHMNPWQPSKDIAAAKLLILLAIKIKTHGVSGWVSLTYDEMTEVAGLSRTLVCKGIRRLEQFQLIMVEGAKKKRYSLRLRETHKGWTKIPAGSLFDEAGAIRAFKTFHNRYDYELNALRLFLYLLHIRSNGDRYSYVTNATIFKKTGMPYSQIPLAVGFMKSCGLLIERVVQPAEKPVPFDDENLYPYRYELIGSKYLVKGQNMSEKNDELSNEF